MQSSAARAGLLVVLAAAAVASFVVLSGGDDDESGSEPAGAGSATTTAGAGKPAPAPFEAIELRDGAPVGGVRKLTYAKGDRVRIEVKLDEPQEDIHIHGYEQEKLNPSRSARFDFPASLEGIYELEAHGPSGDVLLAEIVVNPA